MAVPAARLRAALLLGAAALLPFSAALAASVPDIIISANYTPTPADQVGSTVTVVNGNTISRAPPGSVAALLRSVPGVTVLESGGPGGSTDIRLRGADTGDTVVLINGVRVNDPAAAHDDYDFVMFSTNDIARIEVLRGPQSAVYGSDATGGVINIITKRQTKPSSLSATIEGGTYGTLDESASAGMRAGDFSLRASGEHYHTDGFSRRGNPTTDEPDGADRTSGTATLTYAPADGPSFEASATATHETSDYDGAGITGPDMPNVATRNQISGYAKLTMPTFAWLTQSLTLSGMNLDRQYSEPWSSPSAYGYTSSDVGGAYQAVADLGHLGTLTAGATVDAARAHYAANGGTFSGFDAANTDWAAYVQHQFDPFDNFHVTLSGRYDGQTGGDGFLTGRAAVAYDLPNQGTTLRASIGTGAKRPTAYQVANNAFAATIAPVGFTVDTDLQPEHSWGADTGIEQSLFGGKLKVSATAFYNRFSNLLEFEFFPDFVNGAYENIDEAEAYGLELAADAEIIPDTFRASVTYTWMPTRDLNTGIWLPRRPLNSGSFTLTFTPDAKVELSLTGTVVGARTNTASSPLLTPGYYTLDAYGSYALSDKVKLFARVNNLTNTLYQDPVGYNAPGASALVGLTWNE